MPIIIFLTYIFSITHAAENASCLGFPREYEITHNAEMIFSEAHLPAEAKREELFKDAARFQNFYAFAEMASFQRPQSIKMGGYDVDRIQITITGTEKVPYPYELIVDRKAPPVFQSEVQAYLGRVTNAKGIKKGSPGLKVSYTFSTKLSLCQLTEAPLVRLNWPLPLEPYFAFFITPPNQRVKMRNPAYGEGFGSPCGKAEQIGPKGQVLPYALWYYWSPYNKGTSSDGNAFECASVMKEGVDWKDVSPQLVNSQMTAREPRLTFLKEKKTPLKMSFLFSAHKNEYFKSMTELQQLTLKQLVADFLKTQDFIVAKNKLPNEKYDQGISAMLIFLWNLERNSIIKSHTIKTTPLSVDIRIKGVLKQSVKPYEMQVFLAPNDIFQDGHTLFTNEFVRALSQDDVVIYTGHASLGSALFEGIQKSNHALRENNAPPSYQFISLLTCGGAHYYPPSRFNFHGKSIKRDFVYSTGVFTESTNVGAVTLLGVIDQAMRQEKWPAFQSWVGIAKYNNFLTYHLSDQ